jgi:hypothetical protein
MLNPFREYSNLWEIKKKKSKVSPKLINLKDHVTIANGHVNKPRATNNNMRNDFFSYGPQWEQPNTYIVKSATNFHTQIFIIT